MSEISDLLRKQFKEGDDIRDAGLITPADVIRYDDIRYGKDDACQLLDVYRPKEKDGELLPVIFSVHGGGWVYGDKERYQYYCMSLAELDFAVVNFTYRLAPEHKFPAPMEDTNLVIQWILENAKEYDMDTAHIFGVGDSAGATDLALYAAICTNPDYAKTYPFTVPTGFRPTAIALNCGAYLIEESADSDDPTAGLMHDFLPGGATKSELEQITVPPHITENYVPTYVMTCTGDFLLEQAGPMVQRLVECRVPCEFQFYGDKDHELGHVFHVNMKLEQAHQCNRAQGEYFKSFCKG